MIRRFFLCIMIFTFIFSCQARDVKKISPEELLQLRLNEFVQSKNSKDMEKLYHLYSPSYREKVSLIQFVQTTKSDVSISGIDSIELSDTKDHAKVFLKISFNMMGFPVNDLKIPNDWIMVDGQWYLDGKVHSMKELFLNHPKK